HGDVEAIHRVGQRAAVTSYEITASASISTFHRSSSSALTTIIVAVGHASARTSPCALPTASASLVSVTNMRVRTTWSRDAPASSSAVAMISRQRLAWTYGSGSTEPSGHTGAV